MPEKWTLSCTSRAFQNKNIKKLKQSLAFPKLWPSVYNLSPLFSCPNLFRNVPFQTLWDGVCVTVAAIVMSHILGVTSPNESGRSAPELLTLLHAVPSWDSRLGQ